MLSDSDHLEKDRRLFLENTSDDARFDELTRLRSVL